MTKIKEKVVDSLVLSIEEFALYLLIILKITLYDTTGDI
jgi:hypothetical protein